MAGLILNAGLSVGVSVALSAGVDKNVLTLTAPTNQRVKLLGVGVFLDGVTLTNAPGDVRLVRVGGGTVTGTTLVPVKANPSNPETAQSALLYNCSGESSLTTLKGIFLSPLRGYEYVWNYGEWDEVPGDGVIAIMCRFANSVNVKPWIRFEE